MSRWYVRTGRSGAWKYAAVTPGSISLVPDLADATRFDSKADAILVQLDLVAEMGLEAACISDCPRPAK
jgi:hypothetical protein